MREAGVDAIQIKFEAFDLDNPHVLDKIIEFAQVARNKGFEHYAIGTIYECIRWHTDIETTDDQGEGFCLNNNYRSRYVRLIESLYPEEWGGFFRKRTINTERPE